MRGSFPQPQTAPSPGSGLSPVFQALLTAEPLSGQSALDIGTGWGRLALWLAPRCAGVTGVDRDVPWEHARWRRLAATARATGHAQRVTAPSAALETSLAYLASTPVPDSPLSGAS